MRIGNKVSLNCPSSCVYDKISNHCTRCMGRDIEDEYKSEDLPLK